MSLISRLRAAITPVSPSQACCHTSGSSGALGSLLRQPGICTTRLSHDDPCRGGNTTLLKPDFQVPRKGSEEPSSGSGSGSGSTGGSGGSGGGGGDEGDPDQPEQNPGFASIFPLDVTPGRHAVNLHGSLNLGPLEQI